MSQDEIKKPAMSPELLEAIESQKRMDEKLFPNGKPEHEIVAFAICNPTHTSPVPNTYACKASAVNQITVYDYVSTSGSAADTDFNLIVFFGI